jgi:hypothetical protein
VVDPDSAKLTETRQFVGTMRYASPEQVLDAAHVDHRSDVYSLGVVLWELLTLRPIYGFTDKRSSLEIMHSIQYDDPVPPRRLNPAVPAELEAVALKCLEKKRDRRYATARVLADDLARWLRGEAVSVRLLSRSDRLWRVARRHRRRVALGLVALLLLAAGYVGMIDAGYRFPGHRAVQGAIDGYGLSAFRRPPDDAAVRAAAEDDRSRLLETLARRHTEDGWITRNAKAGAEREVSVWSHSQALYAVLDDPDLTAADLRPYVPGLDVPFTGPIAPIEVDGQKYGWLGYAGCDYTMSLPAIWLAAALARALHVPGLLTDAERERVLAHLLYVQQSLARYHSAESGGWNMFPDQKDMDDHDPYTSALALMTLLEVRRSGLPWDGSAERRDALLAATARWLVGQYAAGEQPPGWGTTSYAFRTSDGLTLQTFGVLLRAEQEAGAALPDALLARIPLHLAECHERTLDFPISSGQVSRTFKDHTGKERLAVESINFPWHSGAVEACVFWLRRAEARGAPRAQVVEVRRVLGHLVIDLGQGSAARVAGSGTFLSAETLLGFSSLRPPE